MTYNEWLLTQPPERQIASLMLGELCEQCGIEERKSPFSERAIRLKMLIAECHRIFDKRGKGDV